MSSPIPSPSPSPAPQPPLFSLLDSDRLQSERLPGGRLQRLEVYNWGTFDQNVWSFEVGGRNALLTGEIGTGKSTLVDAVTTLLLPAHKISYNRAAGADTRERDLKSYVEGHYKAERNETTGASRPVGMRDARSYSVILGTFANVDFDTSVTLAQVFRTKDVGQPERFYAVADTVLSLTPDFSDFGTDLTSLKRRLRSAGVRVYDTFPEYGKDFRRRLGIESEQAMELFHQTVSMKAVDNLNDFVRNHMLEPFDAGAKIDALIEHFEDLTRAHEAVVRARDQLALLTPMVELLDEHERLAARADQTERLHRALPYHFARLAQSMYTERLEELEANLRATRRQLEERGGALEGLRTRADQLRVDIAGRGGDRLAAIEQEIRRLEQEQPARQDKLARYNGYLAEAGMEPVGTGTQFASAQDRARSRLDELERAEAEAQNRALDREVEKRKLDDEAAAANAELHSLRSRPTSIPSTSLELRAQLCAELDIDAATLPFAGELIAVRADAAEWEGAAERVLRVFALSLLVPSPHYEAVATWVDRNHLGTRLVYYRVAASVAPVPAPDRRSGRPLLLDMLELKPDSGFEAWLEAELARRANHACVESATELRTAQKAVTRAGQVKDRERHEKDDRRRVGDRREYVLGWSNQQKIEAMVAHATELHRRQWTLAETLQHCRDEVSAVAARRRALDRLDGYRSWEELDWEGTVRRIADLGDERARLLAASDRLAALADELRDVAGSIGEEERAIKQLEHVGYGFERDEEAARQSLERAQRTLAEPAAAEVPEAVWAELEAAVAKVAAKSASGAKAEARNDLSIATLEETERATGDVLAEEGVRTRKRQSEVGQRAIGAMSDFRNRYAQETLEFDASLDSATDFRQLHARVAGDDLPRFEKEFKDYLNQNTIREVASLAAQLDRHEELIRQRIETINRSLVGIDYNEGRYITLAAESTPNTEVREFRADLRACTDDVVGTGDDQYSEQKFLQVKKIIDRFKGREGFTDVDKLWKQRVTDVRQWYVFSASERWREDDAEYEHYADSAGKSGGQKEKLAYTILAASLAYQFKLDWDAERSKSFRLVVIDEAFGRGSEVSTQYALTLFTRLGLQLLIVTPLQKLHVIEPFVSTVGFVENRDGNYSRLQTLTIAEYRRRRGERQAGRSGTGIGEAGPAA
jgi:uncharacterized protein YPO0396